MNLSRAGGREKMAAAYDDYRDLADSRQIQVVVLEPTMPPRARVLIKTTRLGVAAKTLGKV